MIENVQLAKTGRYTISVSGQTTDAVSRPFGLRGYVDVKLRFWRWLNSRPCM